MSFRTAVAAFFLVSGAMVSGAQAQITASEWADYSSRFVSDEGRVIDDGNGGISHSEGQGYGLLLAFLAGNKPDFARIWSFTQRELMIRDDHLAAWKWDPNETPKITDVNNASDGDILIAYALALAGKDWDEPRFTQSARSIADALGASALFSYEGETLLLPGVHGFGADDHPDWPVVNPSYWIFEAVPVLAGLAPDIQWKRLSASGNALISKASFGKNHLPADWVSVAGTTPRPAEGFPVEFGYNSVRIPLYLMRSMDSDMSLLRRLRDGMTGPQGAVTLIDLTTDQVTAELDDPGYRLISALATCVLDGTRIPQDLRVFAPTLYYPATLQLLALAHIRKDRPECL